MLKYEHIISRLSESRKIMLLTDIGSLSRKEFKNLGLPTIKTGRVEEYMHRVCPSSVVLANSWNTDLTQKIADNVFAAMAEDGVNLALMQGSKVKFDPRKTALSEDPILSSTMAAVYLKAAENKGVAVCITDYCIENSDIEWLDKVPDKRVIAEYLEKPQSDAAKEAKPTALMTDLFIKDKEYGLENLAIASDATTGENRIAKFIVCENASETQTVKLIQKGVICLKGSGFALENAIKRYEQLTNGETSAEEIEAEVGEGKAVSSELIDEAVDRVIAFVMECNEKQSLIKPMSEKREALFSRSVKESAVLLQNRDKCLPLAHTNRIFIVGDIKTQSGESVAERCTMFLTDMGYGCVDSARGYEIDKDRSEECLDEVLDYPDDADIVLLLFGTDREREAKQKITGDLHLPANQEALAHSLLLQKRKVVSVVSSSYSFDVRAVENFDAVMVMDLHTDQSPEALADIVTGQFNPSGKLSNTLYRNTDHVIKKQRYYKSVGMKSGCFIGYRYYDTVDYNPGFCFGHGIGYSDFHYSHHRLKKNKVIFKLSNRGKLDGVETVQMYVGMKSKSTVRPKKELVSFLRVALKAGESRTVEMDLALPSVYDEESGKYVTEKGEYEIYVGSSVSDIRFSVSYNGGDSELNTEREGLYKYLQSESNIIAEKYTLEANYGYMKKTIKNLLSGISLLILTVLLRVYCRSNDIENGFLNFLSVALAVIAGVFFVSELVERRKLAIKEKADMESANQQYFADAETLEIFSTERMFADEFDSKTSEEGAPQRVDDDLAPDRLAYIDKDFDLAVAAKELETFAFERGLKLEFDKICEILASIVSSKLIVLHGMNDEDFKLLMNVLGEYFDSDPHVDTVDEGFRDAKDVLFDNDLSKRPTMIAIETARAQRHKVHFAALTNVKLCDVDAYFTPFARYAKNPDTQNAVKVNLNASSNNTYYVPQNLWFVLNLADVEAIDTMPKAISEIASVTDLSFVRCEIAENTTPTHRFYYYQMEYIVDRIVDKCAVGEATWKKLDSFVAELNKATEYSITNKQWVGLERFIAAFASAGEEIEGGFKHAIASRILPDVLALMSKDEISFDLVGALNGAFDEETADFCRKTLKAWGKKKSDGKQ